jgi:hypothetical protein
MKVVGTHHAREAGGFSRAHVREHLARRILLVGSVVADQRHGPSNLQKVDRVSGRGWWLRGNPVRQRTKEFLGNFADHYSPRI